LFINAFEHGFTPFLQLTQVAEAELELAQLDVVEAAGDFLAVTGNKRHGGAAVEQLHRGLDLVFLDPDFCGDLANDFLHLREK
jgi:hypothetical protein